LMVMALQLTSLRCTGHFTLLAFPSALLLACTNASFASQDKIYTNVGTIVISVNPYQRLPLYSRDVVEK
jgi:hypothetical protein